jgi:hypothetical protein
MLNKMIMWSMLIVPWLTLFFMDRQSIKRYMPVAVFTSFMVTVIFEIGHAFDWWVLLDQIVPWGYITNPGYAYGVFPVLTIWIFYFTYENFGVYFITNVVINFVHGFFLNDFFEARQIVRYVNISEFNLFLLGVVQAVIVYVYHRWQERIFKESNKNRIQTNGLEFDLTKWLKQKEKIK